MVEFTTNPCTLNTEQSPPAQDTFAIWLDPQGWYSGLVGRKFFFGEVPREEKVLCSGDPESYATENTFVYAGPRVVFHRVYFSTRRLNNQPRRTRNGIPDPGSGDDIVCSSTQIDFHTIQSASLVTGRCRDRRSGRIGCMFCLATRRGRERESLWWYYEGCRFL